MIQTSDPDPTYEQGPRGPRFPKPNPTARTSLGCTCTLALAEDSGTVLDNPENPRSATHRSVYRIIYCPMHNAAPALLEALKELLRTEAVLDDGEPALQDARKQARTAIRQALGK